MGNPSVNLKDGVRDEFDRHLLKYFCESIGICSHPARLRTRVKTKDVGLLLTERVVLTYSVRESIKHSNA